ncbi:MAG: LytTR family transcriptional regulator DNA-binding domain-containing protein, partial [Ignavibacteriaceae bacterium]
GMELGADDYITKPFKIDEITNAVKIRFKKQELLSEARNKNSVVQEEKTESEKVSDTGHVIVEVNKQPRFIQVNSISCITAFSEYTYVYLGENEKLIIRRLLKKWEEILPASIFLRIHRSTIINLNHIEKVEKWFNNSFAIFIKGFQEPFIVSRRYSVHLKTKLHYR